MSSTKKQRGSPKYLGALDQGTTSTRFIVFDSHGNMIGSAQKEHTQIMPRQGAVEHDPMEIWVKTQEVMNEALIQAKLKGSDLAGIGITNQRETTIVWNKRTGKPYGNAIVWMDMRAQPLCDQLAPKADAIREKTGLPVSPYFSGTKIRWILDHVPGARADAEKGDAIAGTVDSWLMWNLSGGTCHATDVTNASRYLLMNLKTLQWDPELCEWLGIPIKMLPRVASSSEVYFSAEAPGCIKGCKIAGVLGDQQSALVGQGAFQRGMAKNTYGTGLFMLMNTGETPVVSKSGLVTTVAYQMGPGRPAVYALEGSVAIGGALVQWLRDNLGIISSSSEVDKLARGVDDNGGVYIVPAFSGLYAPYWRKDARGVIAGLTRFADKRHFARAALESTAYQTHDVFDAMIKDSGVALKELRVDGGMVVNELLMQFQADILDVQVARPKVTETTALGAAYAAGLAVGVWASLDEVAAEWPGVECVFKPHMEVEKRSKLLASWKKAIEKSLGWEETPTAGL